MRIKFENLINDNILVERLDTLKSVQITSRKFGFVKKSINKNIFFEKLKQKKKTLNVFYKKKRLSLIAQFDKIVEI